MAGGTIRASPSVLRRTRIYRQIPERSTDSSCCRLLTPGVRNRDRDGLRMLYRGDFVYTETLSDLRICRDYLLGKL